MAAAAENPREAARERMTGADAQEEPRHVLLVEDDDGDAMIVSELLVEAWPVLRIDRVGELSEAIARLNEDVDCVLLDLGLPDSLGVDAVRRVREADPEMPVVVLTGDVDELRGIEALGAGAQDYLIKGTISGASLARAIRHSVQRKLAERFARELAVVRAQSAENARVQRGLIPNPVVEDKRISVMSAYRPGNQRQILGGDFFDVVQNPDGLHILIGDVCGHGPDEAALGVELRIAWRTLIMAGVPQRSRLATLDRLLIQERQSDHIFATATSVRIDLVRRTATIVMAGHPAPIRLDGERPMMLTGDAPRPPLGLGYTPPDVLSEVEIGDSWTLLFYSDGVYEGRVVGQEERLGLDGLLRTLAGAPRDRFDPELLIDRVEELNQGPLDDDVALLAVKRDGPGD
jgi:serine phosphatase RsbU (regulator of sigma subunit)